MFLSKTALLTLSGAIALLLASSSANFGVDALNKCTNPTVRSEWRQLTKTQQTAYLSALKKIKSRAKGPDANMNNWNYDQFTDLHLSMSSMTHNDPIFFPWHRMYVSAFESALKSIDPSIIQPYWDWSLDSQNTTASPIFAADAFGGNGDRNTRCVTDGVAKGWGVSPRQYTTKVGNCVAREYSTLTSYSPMMMNTIYTTSNGWTDFRKRMEGAPHGSIHDGIGGTFILDGVSSHGDMTYMSSPNDPLFWMHHTFVDKIWSKWQNLCDKNIFDFGTGGSTVILQPFGNSIYDVMNTNGNGTYCYKYTDTQADTKIQGICPTPIIDANGTVVTPSPAPPAPPQWSLSNFTSFLDTSSPFWLHSELRSLLFPNTVVPMKPFGSSTGSATNLAKRSEAFDCEEAKKSVPAACLHSPAPVTSDAYCKASADCNQIRSDEADAKKNVNNWNCMIANGRRDEIQAQSLLPMGCDASMLAGKVAGW